MAKVRSDSRFTNGWFHPSTAPKDETKIYVFGRYIEYGTGLEQADIEGIAYWNKGLKCWSSTLPSPCETEWEIVAWRPIHDGPECAPYRLGLR